MKKYYMKTLLNKKLIEISKEKAEELANYYRKQIINMSGQEKEDDIFSEKIIIKDVKED